MLCRVFSGVMGVGLLTNMAVRILDRGGGSENERRGQARPKGPTVGWSYWRRGSSSSISYRDVGSAVIQLPQRGASSVFLHLIDARWLFLAFQKLWSSELLTTKFDNKVQIQN